MVAFTKSDARVSFLFKPGKSLCFQWFSSLPGLPGTLTHIKAVQSARVYPLGMAEQPLIDARTEKIFSLHAETQFAPNGVVSRTLLRTTNVRAVLFGIAE